MPMEINKKNWGSHIEFAIMLVTLIGGFYLIDAKIERTCSELSFRIERQSERTDRLYEMFIDLLKETKK